LSAARGLFEINGFRATSMDDIVEAAGTSAGGLYRYLPGKDAIITAIAGQVVGGLTSSLTALLAEDEVPSPSRALREVVVQIDAPADGPGRLALTVA
jgi:AcrR family transcriptional regulator